MKKRATVGRRPVDHEMFSVGAQLLLRAPEPVEDVGPEGPDEVEPVAAGVRAEALVAAG